jgi:hypothetical protein
MPQSQYPRNLFVYDANVPSGTDSILVGGGMQLGSTTAQEFYSWLQFCFSDPSYGHFRLMGQDGAILPQDAALVQPGNYLVVSEGLFILIYLLLIYYR